MFHIEKILVVSPLRMRVLRARHAPNLPGSRYLGMRSYFAGDGCAVGGSIPFNRK
jgi:hypothetical protein